MEIDYTKLLSEEKWDNIAKSYTACVGWDVCQCNRCRFARTAIQHISKAKKEVFDDIEKRFPAHPTLMKEYRELKERHLSTFDKSKGT